MTMKMRPIAFLVSLALLLPLTGCMGVGMEVGVSHSAKGDLDLGLGLRGTQDGQPAVWVAVTFQLTPDHVVVHESESNVTRLERELREARGD